VVRVDHSASVVAVWSLWTGWWFDLRFELGRRGWPPAAFL